MKSYQDLGIWKKSIELVVKIYTLTKDFPEREKFGIISQIQRAAVSIPSNIAEGWGEYIKFITIARGSLYEVETQLIISHRINYISKEDMEEIIQETAVIGKMILGLIRVLDKEIK